MALRVYLTFRCEPLIAEFGVISGESQIAVCVYPSFDVILVAVGEAFDPILGLCLRKDVFGLDILGLNPSL